MFGADKIDATGTLGIARTLLYKENISTALLSWANGRCQMDQMIRSLHFFRSIDTNWKAFITGCIQTAAPKLRQNAKRLRKLFMAACCMK